MAATITIDVPPNTTVILPDDETLFRAVSAPVAVRVVNNSGETLDLDSGGVATKFTVDEVPATIAEAADDLIELTFLSEGELEFDDGIVSSVVSIETLVPPPPVPDSPVPAHLGRRGPMGWMARSTP